MEKQYLDKWFFFPWLKNNNLDFLIHNEDLKNINGLGIIHCILEENDFLTVKNKEGIYRVKKEGIKMLLPEPKFKWGEEVFQKKYPAIKGVVNDFFWHHIKNQFQYYIDINDKLKSKQLSEDELEFWANRND